MNNNWLSQANLEYVSDHVDAVKLADAKRHQCAVLMNATPIEQVKRSRRSWRHPAAKVHSLPSEADGRFGFRAALCGVDVPSLADGAGQIHV